MAEQVDSVGIMHAIDHATGGFISRDIMMLEQMQPENRPTARALVWTVERMGVQSATIRR